MTPYVQGYCQALIKLGLSPSAGAATGGLGAAGLKASLTGASKGVTVPKPPSPPKPPTPGVGQYNAEPKMQGETAWQNAQKALDVGESRAMGKVDKWQSSTPLATGSV